MMYGLELIRSLEKEIERNKEIIRNRMDRIDRGETDMDDCFVSQKLDDRAIDLAERKIRLLNEGGCAWFREYATLEGELVDAKWVKTKYGPKLRVNMPDGSVVWTTATTKKGLEKKGIKHVECLRPAWFVFKTPNSGLLGAYTGYYELFPSDVNYATGEEAGSDPVEIKDVA